MKPTKNNHVLGQKLVLKGEKVKKPNLQKQPQHKKGNNRRKNY